jgi:hypothetical protein
MWWWCCVHGVLLWVSLILQAGKRINGISRDTSATITWIRWTSSGGASSCRWGPTRRQKNTLRNRSHTYISDLSPKKSSPSPPPKKIRHAATAMTGVGWSVASTIWAFLCSRHAAKKRHVDRTASRCPQHRRPWSTWLTGFCGGVAAIFREKVENLGQSTA